jgi:hypothetical protein
VLGDVEVQELSDHHWLLRWPNAPRVRRGTTESRMSTLTARTLAGQ